MKSIDVSAEHEYKVLFVDSWQESLAEVISDHPTVAIYPATLKDVVSNLAPEILRVEVPDGEEQKSIENFSRVLNVIAHAGIPRHGLIIGIGGGATTDLAGYVAASYLRGIDWVAIPTSLSGMVDAAIGGKTGINLEAGKNLAGAFHSPIKVIIDQSFLTSLGDRDLRAGLAEVAKCGFIADLRILDLIEKDWKGNLSELIYRAVKVKADVVGRDFRESFEREVLNYGHTLGHAIERDSNFELRHGESVSIGLIYAAALSRRFSGLSESEFQRHVDVLQLLGLPTSYSKLKWRNLLELMNKDKKKRVQLRFVTLSGLGKPVRLEMVDVESLQNVYEQVIGR